jgi:hypothetical protein
MKPRVHQQVNSEEDTWRVAQVAVINTDMNQLYVYV